MTCNTIGAFGGPCTLPDGHDGEHQYERSNAVPDALAGMVLRGKQREEVLAAGWDCDEHGWHRATEVRRIGKQGRVVMEISGLTLGEAYAEMVAETEERRVVLDRLLAASAQALLGEPYP
jgi:hypothetical protein